MTTLAIKKTPICHALVAARGRRTQDEMAAIVKCAKTSIVNYETGRRMPDIDFLATVASVTGADFLDLLRLRLASSEDAAVRQMAERLQLRPESVPPQFADMDRLQASFEAVEEGLAAARIEMPVDKKAELLMAVYDMLGETPAISKGLVLKLIKLAA